MPELAYRITEWKSRYEVTYKGRDADDNTGIEELRHSPLAYVKLKVFGHNTGPAYRRMMKMSEHFGPSMGPAVFGIFCKLLELSGNSRKEYRGWILCEKQKPMTAEEIADLILVDGTVVSRALEILCNPKIGWIQQVEYVPPKDDNDPKVTEIPEHSGTVREIPEPFANETETETRTRTLTETKTKTVPEKPGTTSVSISRGSDFGSDSATVARLKATEELERIFPKRTSSDDKAIRHILQQVQQDRYLRLIEDARECQHGNNPLALFMSKAKRLGFRGNGGP